MSVQTKTPITGLRTVGVPVTDQDRALAFYVEKLGFEKRLDTPLEEFGGHWIEVAPPGAETTIALVPTREGMPTGVETGVRLTTRDAAEVHTDLETRGVDVGELLRWPGVPPMFAVRDHTDPASEADVAAARADAAERTARPRKRTSARRRLPSRSGRRVVVSHVRAQTPAMRQRMLRGPYQPGDRETVATRLKAERRQPPQRAQHVRDLSCSRAGAR